MPHHTRPTTEQGYNMPTDVTVTEYFPPPAAPLYKIEGLTSDEFTLLCRSLHRNDTETKAATTLWRKLIVGVERCNSSLNT